MNAIQLSEQDINDIDGRFDLNCKLLGYAKTGKPLTSEQAAAVCGCKRNTLEQKRMNGTGPAYIQPEGGKRVLYPEPLLVDWLASGLKKNTYKQH